MSPPSRRRGGNANDPSSPQRDADTSPPGEERAPAACPDWRAHVRRRLSQHAGIPARAGRHREVVEEIAQHLEDAYRDAIAAGMSPQQAETHLLEHHADWRALSRTLAAPTPSPPDRRNLLMDSFAQDVRFAARSLAARPLFTLSVLFLLAFGIGANTALFTVVNGVLLAPLPYPEPHRLLAVAEADRGDGAELQPSNLKAANLQDLRARARTLEDIAGYWQGPSVLTGGDEPEMVATLRASNNFFAVLGVGAALGSTFAVTPEEAAFTAVLDHGYWQRRFAADPDVVGSALILDGQRYTVVGVMPEGFSFLTQTDAFIAGARAVPKPPIDVGPDYASDRSSAYMKSFGRLAPGVTPAQAAAELDAIGRALEAEFPEEQRARTFISEPLHESVVGSVRGALLLLLGAVGFVLLIACANVANLMLSRASSRSREIAVRTALGASRSRVLRQLLTESVALSLAGGLLGIAVTAGGVGLLRGLLPGSLPRAAQIGFDLPVLAFALTASVATGIVFGLAPALQSSVTDVQSVLRDAARGGSAGRGRARLGDALVVGEIALAVVLLIGAGLALRSLMALQARDPGFEPERVLTLRLSLPAAKYDSKAKIVAMYWRLYDEIRALPGVESAATVFGVPFSGMRVTRAYTIAGRPADEEFGAIFQAVSPGYFATLGIPSLAGRDFARSDTAEAPMVAIVNEALARRHFAGVDPLAQAIDLGDGEARRIVGVVGSTRYGGYDSEAAPEVYLAFEQFTLSFTSLVVRAAGDPEDLVDAIRRKVLEIDPDQPVHRVQTLTDLMRDTVAQPRFSSRLLLLFAAVALVLSAVGVFGVISYAVTQRTREFGIRMALGAETRRVRGMVLRHGALLAGIGVAAGLAAAALLARLARSQWFGIEANDPLVFAVVPVALAAVALLAAWLPARRATRVDPVVALRAD